MQTPLTASACGDDDAANTTAKDASVDAPATGDAGPDVATDASSAQDAPADQSTQAVKCTQAEFDAVCGMQGGNCTGPQNTQIDIAFPTTPAPQQYVNHCVRVKTGTIIDFAGDFVLHPLRPAGGDLPTPIPTQTTNPPNGTSGMPELLITVSKPGTYGFECATHPSQMFGAIQVVP